MSTTTPNFHYLSTREREVFDRIVLGTTPSRIATDLSLSVKTVSTYRARVMQKLGIKSNAEMATLKAQAALAVAADHTLIASALVAGVARWEVFTGANDGSGEVAVGGLHHATRLDAHGVPVLTPMLRAALTTKMLAATLATAMREEAA